MKSIILAVAMFLVAVPATETLTQAERDKGIAELEGSKKAFLEATKGLSEAQWNFKQAPDRWSVAEVTEHIAAAEDLLMGLIQSQVMTAPARTGPEDVKALDEFVLQRVRDRSQKAHAPEPLKA